MAGQTAPAKQRIYCHGKPCLSSLVSLRLWHTDTHTNLWQKLDQSFQLPPKLLPNLCLPSELLFSPPSSLLLAQTKVSTRQPDNQTGAQSMHIISTHIHTYRHTLTYMMSRLHLPWQPNNEPHWHSSPAYLSPGRLEKRSRLSYLGALFFSFSLCHAFTLKSFSTQPHSQSLKLECLI